MTVTNRDSKHGYLVVRPVIEGRSNWPLMGEHPVSILRFHRHHRDLVVERNEQLVPPLIKEHDGLHLAGFGEHTGQSLDAYLQSHVPDTQHLDE